MNLQAVVFSKNCFKVHLNRKFMTTSIFLKESNKS